MVAKSGTKANNGLDLSDLNGDISSPIVFKDGHFGLESAIWDKAQRIADMLPIKVQLSGDLAEESVFDMTEKAKGVEIQVKYWTEYTAQLSRFLKGLHKVREKQAESAENVAETRVKIAELEKDLGAKLASLEGSYRQAVAGYRSTIATAQDDLTISLNRISEQYSDTKSKKQERLTEDKKTNETAYAKQTATLVEKFRKTREARYNGAGVGLTKRIA